MYIDELVAKRYEGVLPLGLSFFQIHVCKFKQYIVMLVGGYGTNTYIVSFITWTSLPQLDFGKSPLVVLIVHLPRIWWSTSIGFPLKIKMALFQATATWEYSLSCGHGANVASTNEAMFSSPKNCLLYNASRFFCFTVQLTFPGKRKCLIDVISPDWRLTNP